MKRIFLLTVYNLRFVTSYNMLISAAITVLGIFVFGAHGLTPAAYTRMCEYLTIFAGPVSLIMIADYECSNHVWELVYNRRQAFIPIYVFRIIAVCIENAILQMIPYVVVRVEGQEMSFDYYWGILVTIIWFGMTGMFVAELTGSKQIAFGFMILYYLFESLTKGRITGNWQLMGYSNNCPVSKIYLCLLSLVLLIIMVFMKLLKVKGIYDNRDRNAQ